MADDVVSADDANRWETGIDDATRHSEQTDIHITEEERERWNDTTPTTELSAHFSDNIRHITAAERTRWNNTAPNNTFEAHINNENIHTTVMEITRRNAGAQINDYPRGHSTFQFHASHNLLGWPAQQGTVETLWLSTDHITQLFTNTDHVHPQKWFRIGHSNSEGGWSNWQRFTSERELPQPATTNPLVAGNTAIGTSTQFARADHIHPPQINITGNAGTAARLSNNRLINGTNFNGSEGITTARWGHARTITLTGAVAGSISIDGSQNVTINTSFGNTALIADLTDDENLPLSVKQEIEINNQIKAVKEELLAEINELKKELSHLSNS